MGLKTRHLLLVAGGGAAGALIRGWLDLIMPLPVQWTTFTINLVGSFALGVLLAVASRQRSSRLTQIMRYGFGTGLLGGFTTYSAFIMDTVALSHSHLLQASMFAFGTVTAGVLAAAAGTYVGQRHQPDES